MISQTNPDKELIPSGLLDVYCQFNSHLALKTSYYHIYRQVALKSDPAKPLDIKVLNTKSGEYAANPSIVTTIFLKEALYHQHCRCCRYNDDNDYEEHGSETVKDIQYEAVHTQNGECLLKIGIVAKASCPVEGCLQSEKSGSTANISTIDIEKMIVDIASELEAMPFLGDKRSLELRQALQKDAESIRLYKVQTGGMVTSRYFVDNWIDMAVSSADIEEVSMLESGIAESESVKLSERMYEVGLLSLRTVRVDKDCISVLESKEVITTQYSAIKNQIEEELDKMRAPKSTIDVVLKIVAVNSQDRPSLDHIIRAYTHK